MTAPQPILASVKNTRKAPTSSNARALEMVRQLRSEGLDVARVILEGRKIEIEIVQQTAPQKIDGVKW